MDWNPLLVLRVQRCSLAKSLPSTMQRLFEPQEQCSYSHVCVNTSYRDLGTLLGIFQTSFLVLLVVSQHTASGTLSAFLVQVTNTGSNTPTEGDTYQLRPTPVVVSLEMGRPDVNVSGISLMVSVVL